MYNFSYSPAYSDFYMRTSEDIIFDQVDHNDSIYLFTTPVTITNSSDDYIYLTYNDNDFPGSTNYIMKVSQNETKNIQLTEFYNTINLSVKQSDNTWSIFKLVFNINTQNNINNYTIENVVFIKENIIDNKVEPQTPSRLINNKFILTTKI